MLSAHHFVFFTLEASVPPSIRNLPRSIIHIQTIHKRIQAMAKCGYAVENDSTVRRHLSYSLTTDRVGSNAHARRTHHQSQNQSLPTIHYQSNSPIIHFLAITTIYSTWCYRVSTYSTKDADLVFFNFHPYESGQISRN